MRIPGLRRAQDLGRRLRSRVVDHALILGYHRIAEAQSDPFSLAVTPQHFAEHLDVLRRGSNPISLAALVKGHQDGNVPRRGVVVTFDDGYADALYEARPLLWRHEVPATVFAVSGALGGRFWWDVLADLVLAPDSLPPGLEPPVTGRVPGRQPPGAGYGAMDGTDGDSRSRLLASLYAELLPMPAPDREELMGRFRGSVEDTARHASQARAMTSAELVQLAADGLVEVGAHSVSHPILARLPLAAQHVEILESKQHLEELLGRPVSSFSYPNGSASVETLRLVRDSGFACACASQQDVVWRGSDVYRLPRFWVPDVDGDQFAGWLAGRLGTSIS